MTLRVRAASSLRRTQPSGRREAWPRLGSSGRPFSEVPKQRLTVCPALPAPPSPAAPRSQDPGAIAVPGSLCARGNRPVVHTPGWGGAAPAPEPRCPRPAPRGGAAGAPPAHCGGGRHRPQKNAPVGGEESVQKLRADRTMAVPSARRAAPRPPGPCTCLYSLLGSEGRWSIGIQIFCTRL